MFGRANPLDRRLTRRQKLVMAIAGGTVLLALIGLGVWGAVAPDANSHSGDGSGDVTIPAQGSARLAVLSRRQCQIAGLLPAGSASTGPS